MVGTIKLVNRCALHLGRHSKQINGRREIISRAGTEQRGNVNVREMAIFSIESMSV